VGYSHCTTPLLPVSLLRFVRGALPSQLDTDRFIVDTWQYFLHRWMHSNKFLYKHFHSVHHRLYVPYAFGALYNHPLEGFVLDSVGAVVAETVANLSIRQAIFLFAFSTMKTVDDHCGYSFPFDPLQMLSGNNSDYHDIHHQVRILYFSTLLSGRSLPFVPILDYRNQVQFLPTFLRSLGRNPGDSNDEEGHRGA
jgi:hypothetical protein